MRMKGTVWFWSCRQGMSQVFLNPLEADGIGSLVTAFLTTSLKEDNIKRKSIA